MRAGYNFLDSLSKFWICKDCKDIPLNFDEICFQMFQMYGTVWSMDQSTLISAADRSTLKSTWLIISDFSDIIFFLGVPTKLRNWGLYLSWVTRIFLRYALLILTYSDGTHWHVPWTKSQGGFYRNHQQALCQGDKARHQGGILAQGATQKSIWLWKGFPINVKAC